MSSEDLKLRAIQIRDEVQVGQNTATRVGQLLLDIIEQSSNLEIIESTDTETTPTDKNLYSALRAKNEDDKRLRNDIEDFAHELINFLKGTKFGEFIPGILTGKGGMIDAFWNGELESLIIRHFL